MTRVTLSRPIEIGATELRVLERLRITRTGKGFLASKEPAAILIRTAGESRAFDADGDEIPLHRLRLQYPHLSELDDY